MIKRKKTVRVTVGNLAIGGTAPITVQTMTTTDTRDVTATVRQIKRLQRAGCDIIRVAVPDQAAARAIGKIKKSITLPLVADIHFNHKLALIALAQGADKIRINPGNIGSAAKVKEVVRAAAENRVPIRIGVNAGSVDKGIRTKYRDNPAQGLAESALKEVAILEKLNFGNIVISLKASSIFVTRKAYHTVSKKVRYPLHVGITEAGPVFQGSVVSAIGIGSLLLDGIGDTIRVSLTGDPAEEVKLGREILRALEIRKDRPRLISCPTCGRCEIDLFSTVKQVDRQLDKIKKPLTVAVMGCAVNGPGEAREADIGIAGGKRCGLLFKKGKVVKKVKERNLAGVLLKEIERI